ncbi:MAG TPA: hypothetical protein VNJ04_12030 [Gemmatimonadaceae bacterium]|nr:hypothetical protein [Gemmatimonadaceae bacterium]
MSKKAIQYPSWLYHATEPARIVESAEEEAALGPAWSDTPAQADEADAKKKGKGKS